MTTYNELIQIREATKDELQVLSPAEYNSAIVGDLLFTTEAIVRKEPAVVRAFVEASERGWRYAVTNPQQTVDLLIKAYPSLDREAQTKMLAAVSKLVLHDVGVERIGRMQRKKYEEAERVLRVSGQLKKPVDLDRVYWRQRD